MKTVSTYTILKNTDMGELIKSVNTSIKQGFQPHGDLIVIKDGQEPHTKIVFIQAMVNHEKE